MKTFSEFINEATTELIGNILVPTESATLAKVKLNKKTKLFGSIIKLGLELKEIETKTENLSYRYNGDNGWEDIIDGRCVTQTFEVKHEGSTIATLEFYTRGKVYGGKKRADWRQIATLYIGSTKISNQHQEKVDADSPTLKKFIIQFLKQEMTGERTKGREKSKLITYNYNAGGMPASYSD